MAASVGQVSAGFSAREIRKEFGSRVVLNDFTLEVPQGCSVGLLGANGSGKTTFLKILLGLMRADAGESAIAGERSAQLSPGVRERIGYVPQSPTQFGWLNGKAMLDYTNRCDRGAHLRTERARGSARTHFAVSAHASSPKSPLLSAEAILRPSLNRLITSSRALKP